MKKIILTIMMMVLVNLGFSQTLKNEWVLYYSTTVSDSAGFPQFWSNKNPSELVQIMKWSDSIFGERAYQEFVPICDNEKCLCAAGSMPETRFAGRFNTFVVSCIKANYKRDTYIEILFESMVYSSKEMQKKVISQIDDFVNIGLIKSEDDRMDYVNYKRNLLL